MKTQLEVTWKDEGFALALITTTDGDRLFRELAQRETDQAEAATKQPNLFSNS